MGGVISETICYVASYVNELKSSLSLESEALPHPDFDLRCLVDPETQIVKTGPRANLSLFMLTVASGRTVVVLAGVSLVSQQRTELAGQHVHLQAVEQPFLRLVALPSTMRPAAQNGLQPTELWIRTTKVPAQRGEEKRDKPYGG